ncbi:putative inner membrane protein [Photobacterium sp. SKA34]|uniref:retron St85 family effector protein n=1 Tax=Photobacterium sp. SKA34 TaxID=121723 RepID=UPI00006ADD6F|nr:retron St85 family effector protein [Photobacterium sp. SKA34]EAR53623.1 putative inner membrane protein [Photobacterium sp. SKA34]
MKNIKELTSTFLANVEVEKISLKNLPNYIFFCGGGLNGNDLSNLSKDQECQVKSLRGAVLHYLSCKEKELFQDVILAEKFHDWLEDANINNLIDFEVLLAGLAAAVILVVEGPGAYAELGVFSVMPQISSKLITIYNTNNVSDGQKTFIEWGPIKYLEKNEKKVLRHEWIVNYQVENNIISQTIENEDEFKALVNLIGCQLVADIQVQSKQTSTFSTDNPSDICLLVADLIYIFSALKLREIKMYINEYLKIDLEEKVLKEYLYSLKNLGLIKEKNAGAKYFLPTDKNQGFIKYHFRKEFGNENNLSASSVKGMLLNMYLTNSGEKERQFAMGFNF